MPIVITKHRTSPVSGETSKTYLKLDKTFTDNVTEAHDFIEYLLAEIQIKQLTANPHESFYPECIQLDRYKDLRPFISARREGTSTTK